MAGERRGGLLGELLRRLFGQAGRGHERSAGPSAAASHPSDEAGPRIDAARDRLKSTIRPPEGEVRESEE